MEKIFEKGNVFIYKFKSIITGNIRYKVDESKGPRLYGKAFDTIEECKDYINKYQLDKTNTPINYY